MTMETSDNPSDLDGIPLFLRTPTITSWMRLEGRPRRVDFDRSLRAEVRDPLWMLCRQWQFGEFTGEDAGSIVNAKVQVKTAKINRYAARGGQAVAFDDSLPLEMKVEREANSLDLMTRAQIGRHWFQLLKPAANLKARYLDPTDRKAYGFVDPPAGSEAEKQLLSDPKASQTLAALKGRVVDGGRLLAAIPPESNAHEKWLADVVPNAQRRAEILKLAEQLRQWFDRVYGSPEPADDPAWAESYLEYQFACSAPAEETGPKQTVLVAEQYHGGRLDWYSFDVNAEPDAQLSDKPGTTIPPETEKLVVQEPLSFIPTPVEFEGMPNVRFWEFEDHKVQLGNIKPSTSELATLILAEFGLIYGNDWSLIPYELETGSLCEVIGIVVTDVFGVRTLVRPVPNLAGSERERWAMYRLSTTKKGIDTRLFLPPATAKAQESMPIERVILARDEMANMVWGVEDIIPSLVSGGMNGFEAATMLENYLLEKFPPEPPPEPKAKIRYQLGTKIYENWIPFIPVHLPGSNRDIRLQRARVLRQVIEEVEEQQRNGSKPKPKPEPKPVEPRGRILRVGLDEKPLRAYFIHEEEVLRAGVVVSRTYQRARWRNGKIHTWLGRRKQTGRGQGASGLEFDQIVPVEQKEV